MPGAIVEGEGRTERLRRASRIDSEENAAGIAQVERAVIGGPSPRLTVAKTEHPPATGGRCLEPDAHCERLRICDRQRRAHDVIGAIELQGAPRSALPECRPGETE